MNYIIKNDKIRCLISSIGAELISAKDAGGYEYIWCGKKGIWEGHAPILFPLCGRLLGGKYKYDGKTYNMGCHGFFPTSTPSVLKHTENSLTFLLKDDENTFACYPFSFEIILNYTVKNNILSVSASVKNTGESTLPFMYGGHPGINVPMDAGLKFEDYSIDFESDKLELFPLVNGPFAAAESKILELDNKKLPLSEGWLEQMGTAIFKNESGIARLFSEKGKKSVTVCYSDAFKYVCLWKIPGDNASYLCIEPWSGIPNDGKTEENFETRPHMERLLPSEEKSFTYTIEFN